MTLTWQVLCAAGALALVIGAFSRRLRRLPLSPPLLALLLGVVLGPAVTGLFDLPDRERARVLLEVARFLLVISLVSTALRYRAASERSQLAPTAFLLLVVMPAMAAVSALLGGLLLGVSGAVAWLLGATLAPTDPVLAGSVVSGDLAQESLPSRLRQVLSMESGANDGLALPLVVLGIALVKEESVAGAAGHALAMVAGGVVVGIAVGVAAARLLRIGLQRRDAESSMSLMYSVVVAVTVLALCRLLGVSGILGAFVAGLLYDRIVPESARAAEGDLDEGLENVLVLPLFLLLGAWLPWSDWGQLGWAGVAFTVLVLALRRLPVVVVVHRAAPLHLSKPGALWLGWFGPVGVATVFYLSHSEHEGVSDPTLWAAGSLVVALSTVVFGLTGAPGTRAYARAADDEREDARIP